MISPMMAEQCAKRMGSIPFAPQEERNALAYADLIAFLAEECRDDDEADWLVRAAERAMHEWGGIAGLVMLLAECRAPAAAPAQTAAWKPIESTCECRGSGFLVSVIVRDGVPYTAAKRCPTCIPPAEIGRGVMPEATEASGLAAKRRLQ